MRPVGALSQKLSKPLRAPEAAGRNRTRTVQLSPAASVSESAHVPPGTTAKSVGFALDDAIPNRQNVKPPAPAFDNVTLTGALGNPTCNEPKSTLAGDSHGSGPASARPPSATLMRPAVELSQKLNLPLRTPVSVGRKRTSTVQLSPAASVDDTTHVPPGTTTKSLGFTLEDAIPNRQNVKPPPAEFDNVTVAGSLDIPT